MAIGGAFLGGGVELVPAGSCKLELEAYTDNATVSATFTITGGGNTYTVTSGTDGRASKVVPSGVTYTVSATVTGYTAPPSQTVIAESSSIKYVRFDAQLKKAQGDISTLQADVKRAQSTADSKASTDVATQSANGLMSKDDKIKLDGIEDTYATISAVQTAQSTADGKVSKSGDTMTGTLTVYGNPFGIINRSLIKQGDSVSGWTRAYQDEVIDSDGKTLGYSQRFRSLAGDGSHYDKLSLGVYSKGGTKTSALGLVCPENGDGYADAPSWSLGTNDNSDKILTIKMANSLPSLVHTTGNETISGMKKFTNTYWNVGGIAFQDPRYGISDAEKPLFNSKFKYLSQFPLLDKNNVIIVNEIIQTNADNSIEKVTKMRDSTNTERTVMSVKLNPSDGTMKMVLRSNTPSNATDTEVATANWTYDKFQRKITYGTGDPPSGGQAGDIYIKI